MIPKKYKKKDSKALKQLKICLDFLKTRDEAFLRKHGISIEEGERLKTELEAAQNRYNLELAELEAQEKELAIAKKQLDDFYKESRTTVKSDNEDNPNQRAHETPTRSQVKTSKKKDKL
jgi:hypothetical protein